MRNRVPLMAAVLVAMLVLLQACSNSAQTSSTNTPTKTETTETEDTESKWDTETLRNDTGKTLIKSLGTEHGKHISFAVISSQGTVIVADPNAMPSKNGMLKADVITTTFINHDHQDIFYRQNNPDARISEMTAESFEVKDVRVTGIAASHTGDPIDAKEPNDVIYVYEVDGLRIAYFAGVDQEQLTEEQLKQLGTVDIVFVSFNDAPVWHVKKEVSIMILNALKPRIVLPTELHADTAEEIRKAANVTDGGEADQLAVNADDLKKMTGTQSIFLKPLKQ